MSKDIAGEDGLLRSRFEHLRELVSINPQMDPEKVLDILERFAQFRRADPKQSQIENSRERLLVLHGYNTSDWVYWLDQQPAVFDKGFTPEDMAKLHARLPESLEILALQGFDGEFSPTPNEYWHAVFVRRRQIRAPGNDRNLIGG